MTRLVVKGALQELEGVLLGRLVGAACSEISAQTAAHDAGQVAKVTAAVGGRL